MDKTLTSAPISMPKRRAVDYGGRWGHAIFRWVIRRLGVLPAYGLLAIVVPYYVLLRASARRSAAHYLKRRFPRDGVLRRTARTALYFYRFGQAQIDQAVVGILGPGHCRVEFPQAQQLRRLIAGGRGLLLVNSHFGCWLAAMASMNALQVPVNLQFRREETKRGRLFFELNGQEAHTRFVDPDRFLGGLIELTQALQRGECVCVMGDRVGQGRGGRAMFLGDAAQFPLTPYQLARASGAPAVVLLAHRAGRMSWRIEAEPLAEGLDLAAMDRQDVLRDLLERYAATLERAVRASPYMWFNFFDLWSRDDRT
jgi:predicted LPLAT superfamily acyltransferase